MPRFLRALCVTLALLLITGAAAPAARAQANLQKATIVIGSPGFIYTLHYVADGAGFFKEEGLAIDTVFVSSGPRQVAAVMGGSADVAPTNIEHIVRSYAQGANMVALSRIYDVSPYVIVLSNKAIAKAGITDGMPIDEKIKRLHGMTIAVTTAGSGTEPFLRNLFLARGGNPDKEVTIQPLGTPDAMLTAMDKGIIDGFSFLAPHSEIPAQKGYGKVVIDPITGELPELKDVPYLAVTTSRETLKAKEPIIRAIVRAYGRAMKLTQENPAEARRLARLFLKEADEDVFNTTFEKNRTALPTDPVITPNQVNNMVRWMNFGASPPLNVTYENIVEPGLAREMAQSILKK